MPLRSTITSSGTSGNWNSATSSSSKIQRKNSVAPQLNKTFKQQKFEIRCTGLKPNTIHKFYYEGVDRAEDCVPHNPKPAGSGAIRPGADLVTDASGTIEFHFYFTIDVEKQVDATNKVKYELAGDKKFELRAENSSAFQIVPFKDHQ
jgi:hypothetical protein